MKIKKIISGLLAAVMLSLSIAESAAAAENAETSPLLDVFCPVNDDSDFPLNIDFVFFEESIQYVDLEEPVYGFESLLNGDVLDFEMNISLKEDFKFFDNYELQIFNADYSEEVFTDAAKGEETLSVSELSVGKGYKFNVILESDSLTASYAGQFTIQIEWSSTLVVDLFYRLADIEGDGVAYADEYQEHDDRNNSITGADVLLHNRKMSGTIKSGDVDYFSYSSANKVSEEDPEEDDRTGVANLEFTLTLTPGAKICMEFFDENNKSVRKYETQGKSSKIYCRLANIPICAIYKIKITTDSSSTVSYELTPSYEFALAWYGQHTSKDDNGVYWNSNKLDTLKYSGTPIFSEDDEITSLFDKACGVVGSAMILRNMYVTMDGYDFRTNYSGKLQADPFTVMLASSGLDGTTMNQNSTSFPTTKHGYAPSYLVSSSVAKQFGINYTTFYEPYVSLNSISAAQEDELSDALKYHKYLLLLFNYKAAGQHFMVLTELKSGNGSFADRAIVYDPGARTYSAGAGLALSQTGWYKSYRTTATLSTARYYY